MGLGCLTSKLLGHAGLYTLLPGLGLQVHISVFYFPVGPGDPQLGPHACMVCTLPAEPAPQSPDLVPKCPQIVEGCHSEAAVQALLLVFGLGAGGWFALSALWLLRGEQSGEGNHTKADSAWARQGQGHPCRRRQLDFQSDGQPRGPKDIMVVVIPRPERCQL